MRSEEHSEASENVGSFPELAFPYCNGLPIEFPETSASLLVAHTIPLKFTHPKGPPCSLEFVMFAPCMKMPKASVDEDHLAD